MVDPWHRMFTPPVSARWRQPVHSLNALLHPFSWMQHNICS